MRRRTSRHRVTALAAALCSSLAPGCRPESPSGLTAEIIADSVGGFSGEQGANGWSYGYWDRTADADTSYGQATDFQLLRHFGEDPVNRLSGRREFTTGPLWNVQDGLYFTSLWAEGGHPHRAMPQGPYALVEHWAVRRWVSTADGTVTISGHAGKVMPWGANWGGGCRAVIVVDGETVWSGVMDERGTDYSVDVTVRVGSRVDFLIGPGPSVGVVRFTATVRASPVGHDETARSGPARVLGDAGDEG